MTSNEKEIIAPAEKLRGEITVPGDKSISHRVVILGSIAEGETVATGFLEGEDNLRTVEAFRAMGVGIETPEPGKVIINGVGLNGLKAPKDTIDAGNSGTTTRLLTGLLSAQGFTSKIDGDDSLRGRPMKRVTGPLSSMGARITGSGGGEYLPLAIEGTKLSGITYDSPVASAQVKSCLLLAGLYASGETVVNEPLKSRDHTERMLKSQGAPLTVNGNSVTVKKVDAPLAPFGAISIPGDISSAAFFMLAALITPDSQLRINNVGINPTRLGIIDIFEKMGADLTIHNERDVSGEPVADIIVKSSNLKGVNITGEELLPAIDEFPAICVAAAYAEGMTTIIGAGELRVKESDRINAMAEALKAVGVAGVTEVPDGITIQGGGVQGGVIESFGDHRVAMAMAVAGLGSKTGITINNSDCVAVSFPGFFDLLRGVSR